MYMRWNHTVKYDSIPYPFGETDDQGGFGDLIDYYYDYYLHYWPRKVESRSRNKELLFLLSLSNSNLEPYL